MGKGEGEMVRVGLLLALAGIKQARTNRQTTRQSSAFFIGDPSFFFGQISISLA
jgi:hypothetical protein